MKSLFAEAQRIVYHYFERLGKCQEQTVAGMQAQKMDVLELTLPIKGKTLSGERHRGVLTTGDWLRFAPVPHTI